MRSKFLIATTAAGALLAAAGLAAAQTTHEAAPGAANATHGQAQGQAGVQDKGRGSAQTGAGNIGMRSDREMGTVNTERSEQNQQLGEGNTERNQRKEQTGASSKQQIEHNNQRSEEKVQHHRQHSETTGERNTAGDRRGVDNEEKGLRGPGRAQSNEGMRERSEQRSSRFESARSVRLSPEQRTKIHDTFIHERVQRVEHPDFSLRVGAIVPRDVQIYDVPEDVVMVIPEYRGLKYIIVRNEVIFLDPDTLQIVAIMPA